MDVYNASGITVGKLPMPGNDYDFREKFLYNLPPGAYLLRITGNSVGAIYDISAEALYRIPRPQNAWFTY